MSKADYLRFLGDEEDLNGPNYGIGISDLKKKEGGIFPIPLFCYKAPFHRNSAIAISIALAVSALFLAFLEWSPELLGRVDALQGAEAGFIATLVLSFLFASLAVLQAKRSSSTSDSLLSPEKDS